jgi:hypothetical protein
VYRKNKQISSRYKISLFFLFIKIFKIFQRYIFNIKTAQLSNNEALPDATTPELFTVLQLPFSSHDWYDVWQFAPGWLHISSRDGSVGKLGKVCCSNCCALTIAITTVKSTMNAIKFFIFLANNFFLRLSYSMTRWWMNVFFSRARKRTRSNVFSVFYSVAYWNWFIALIMWIRVTQWVYFNNFDNAKYYLICYIVLYCCCKPLRVMFALKQWKNLFLLFFFLSSPSCVQQ